jgi:hypothetical protein
VCFKTCMLATKARERAKSVSASGYSYSQVETAIARVLRVDAEGQVGWLRGRIQHLRRLGLTPPADRGPVVYSFELAARWLLALRLERVGLTPQAVVGFFEANWERKPGHKLPVTPLREVIEHARAPVEKARKAKQPHHDDDQWLLIRFDDFTPDAFPIIGRVRPFKAQGSAQMVFADSRDHVIDEVMIPLTELLRRLEAELSGGKT